MQIIVRTVVQRWMVKRMTLIEKEAVLHQIGILPIVWEYGQGVNDCYEIVKQAPTVDAIPVEWIKQFIKKENLDIIHKVGIAYMVEQWKLHPINFEISSEDAIPVSWLTAQAENPSNSDEVRNVIDHIVYRLWKERKEE